MEQTLQRAREFKAQPKTEDVELLCRYLNDRSEEAFTELVSRHIDMVYFAALRRVGGDRHLADDVTQRVFADLAGKASSLKSRTMLTGWLYTSTRFAAAQAMRTERRRRTREQEAHTLDGLHATPEPGWDQLRPVIDEVMDELSEHYREAVLLRFFENLSLAEIGTKLSLSPDAVRMRIDRALDKLRGLLAKRGIASTSVVLAEIFANQSGVAAPSGLVAKIVAAVLSPASAVTAVTFGLWKILTAVAVAAIGAGFIVYEAKHLRPAAVASGSVSQMSHAGQNPIHPTDPAGSFTQAASNSGLEEPSSSSIEAKALMLRRVAFLMKMMTDTQFRASMIALARSRLGLLYQPLFKTLNLPADRLERFKDLLMDKELILNDVWETMHNEHVSYAEWQTTGHQLDHEISQGVDDQIKAFLTASEYAQFVDYSEDFAQWQTVNEVARVLQSTDTPLTDEQANLLVVLLRGGQPKSTTVWNTDMLYGTGTFLSPLKNSKITAPMMEKARGILSPPQMDALRQVQAAWDKKRLL